MRRYTGPDGGEWDVVAGRESWGAFFAIFVPRDEGVIRQAPLSAESTGEANRILADMDDEALEGLLAASVPKDIE